MLESNLGFGDYRVNVVFDHLSQAAIVARHGFPEKELYQIAALGFYQRHRDEEQQDAYANVCWAAECFAAAEALGCIKEGAFSGQASILYLVAVDALDPAKPHNMSNKRIIEETLETMGFQQEKAHTLAEAMWGF